MEGVYAFAIACDIVFALSVPEMRFCLFS